MAVSFKQVHLDERFDQYYCKVVQQKTVQMILQQFFKDEKTKINNEALELITEVITLFVEEAVGRTSRQALKDGDKELSLEHFEKILPQLYVLMKDKGVWCMLFPLRDVACETGAAGCIKII